MQSKAATVADYINSLPPDRREAIQAIREVILKNLDQGIEEGMSYGMIGYFVPHSVYPAGYHCNPKMPLPYAGLASQKQYISLYLMSVYCGCDGGDPTEHATWLRRAWAAAGKKLDMGKSCIRMKSLDDAPLEVIGEAVRRVPLKKYILEYEKALTKAGRGSAGRSETRKTAKAPARKTAARRRAPKSSAARR
jgi:hypothetical protein